MFIVSLVGQEGDIILRSQPKSTFMTCCEVANMLMWLEKTPGAKVIVEKKEEKNVHCETSDRR